VRGRRLCALCRGPHESLAAGGGMGFSSRSRIVGVGVSARYGGWRLLLVCCLLVPGCGGCC